MKFIKTFEGFNIDKFSDFIEKYKKSGYISKSSQDFLNEIGMPNFQKFEDDIKNSLNFFEKCNENIDILNDLILDIEDDIRGLINKKYIWYSLDIRSAFSPSNITVSLDKDRNLPSMNHHHLDDSLNIIMDIIDKLHHNSELKFKDMS